MKYNRALDYTALALASLTQGKTTLAARLLAKAGQEPDVGHAIATLEASNSQAFKTASVKASRSKVRSSRRIHADEFEELGADEFEDLEADMDDMDDMEDPLDDIEADLEDDMGEEDVQVEMARVLSKMRRRSK